MITNIREVEIVAKMDGCQIGYAALDFASHVFGQTLTLLVSDKATIAIGSMVGLSWRQGRESKRFATLTVDKAVKDQRGNLRLVCHEPYARSLGKVIPAASWRDATLGEIVKDILGAAGISRYDLSHLPSAKMARFSYASQCAGWVLSSLRNAVRQYLDIPLLVLPDIDGRLMVGRRADIIQDTGLPLTFASSRDLIARSADEVHLHVYPLLYGQTIGIDGAPHIVDAVSMRVKADAAGTVARVGAL